MELTDFDLELFQTRLEETLAWYLAKAPLADPQADLRTEALTPPGDVAHPNKQIRMNFPRPWTDEMRKEIRKVYLRAEAEVPRLRQAIIDEVVSKRRALLKEPLLDDPEKSPLLEKGRLLIYEPDENLYDGAAEAASEGFFDVDNIPPWDLWLMAVVEVQQRPNTYLLAWIPPECVELTAAGIEVNPEHCIRWAADVDAEFFHRLRSAGLLQ
jgi:hypothetical protein